MHAIGRQGGWRCTAVRLHLSAGRKNDLRPRILWRNESAHRLATSWRHRSWPRRVPFDSALWLRGFFTLRCRHLLGRIVCGGLRSLSTATHILCSTHTRRRHSKRSKLLQTRLVRLLGSAHTRVRQASEGDGHCVATSPATCERRPRRICRTDHPPEFLLSKKTVSCSSVSFSTSNFLDKKVN